MCTMHPFALKLREGQFSKFFSAGCFTASPQHLQPLCSSGGCVCPLPQLQHSCSRANSALILGLAALGNRTAGKSSDMMLPWLCRLPFHPPPSHGLWEAGCDAAKGHRQKHGSRQKYLPQSDPLSDVSYMTPRHGVGPRSTPAFPTSGISLMPTCSTPGCTGGPERHALMAG